MAPTGAKGGLWVKEVAAVSKTPLRALGRVLVCLRFFVVLVSRCNSYNKNVTYCKKNR